VVDEAFQTKWVETQKIIIWSISNFSRGKPVPKFNTVKISIKPMVEHLIQTPVQVLSEDVLWALG